MTDSNNSRIIKVPFQPSAPASLHEALAKSVSGAITSILNAKHETAVYALPDLGERSFALPDAG